MISCVFLHHFNPYFLTKTLELSIAISTYRDICCERNLGDQSVVITKVFFLYFEEADLRVHGVSSSCVISLFDVRPRRACGLAVCTGLESPRVLVGTSCRCCGTE